MGGQRHAPAALPRERPGTRCIGGWVGHMAGLDRCGKSRPPSGMQSPSHPAPNESLYRLSYPSPHLPHGGPLKSRKLETLTCYSAYINPLTPNDPFSGRTAPLTSRRYILYIYSTNVGTEYFKHGIYSPFLSLQNAVCFIILTYLVPVLFTFYIQSVLKLKKK